MICDKRLIQKEENKIMSFFPGMKKIDELMKVLVQVLECDQRT
jgi:hypothetical protein